MSNSYNYCYGETNPVSQIFDTGYAISIGDLVYQDPTDSQKLKSAANFSFAGAAVATPSAPTLADGGHALGTALTNAATHVKVSYQFPWGEGALSAAAAVTPTAGAGIKLSGAALPTPVIGLNIYVETSAGSGTYELWGQVATQPGQQGYGDILITGYGIGQAPPGTTVSQAALALTQYNFAQCFVGVAAQAYDGSNTNAFGIKDGLIRYDTDGVFRFACASASFNPGDLVGPDNNSGALYNQQVVSVSSPLLAIGKVVQQASSVTSIKVKIFAAKSATAAA